MLSRLAAFLPAFLLHTVFSGPVSAQVRVVFPLKASADRRHFTDQAGASFLYAADAAWPLLTACTETDARAYMINRRRQGFNVLQVRLTGLPGEKNPQGHEPFADFDFLKTNEAYFRHADRLIALADSLNLLLAVVPLWQGGATGWAGHPQRYVQRNGREKNYLFGQFVGNRYKQFSNIIWIIGGDTDPGDYREEMRQLARGLKQAAPQQLATYLAASTHASTDVWPPAENWLDFTLLHTYFRGFAKEWNPVQPDVYEAGYGEYRKSPARPFVLGQSVYEDETPASALQVRKQAWWAVLSGAAGYNYGSPAAKGLGDWQKQMNLPGAASLQHLNTLLHTFDWTALVPDQTGELILKGNDTYATNDYAAAALTRDRKLAIVYVPSARGITVNTALLAGKRLVPTWYNPRSGERRGAAQYPVGYKMLFESPDKNDWVLLLRIDDAAK